MKGPGNRADLDVRRLWRCPRCGREQKAGGQVVSVICHCTAGERVFMVLQPPAARRRHVPTPRDFEPVEDYELEPFERPPRPTRNPKGRFSGPKLSDLAPLTTTNCSQGEDESTITQDDFGYLPGDPSEYSAEILSPADQGPRGSNQLPSATAARPSPGSKQGDPHLRANRSRRHQRGRSEGGAKKSAGEVSPLGQGTAAGATGSVSEGDSLGEDFPRRNRGSKSVRSGRGGRHTARPGTDSAPRKGTNGLESPVRDGRLTSHLAQETLNLPLLDLGPEAPPSETRGSGSSPPAEGAKRSRRRRRGGRGAGRSGRVPDSSGPSGGGTTDPASGPGASLGNE